MAKVTPVHFETGAYQVGSDDSIDERAILMHTKHEKLPMKDFASEIRGKLDVNHLLEEKSVILLDLKETLYEDIFNRILDALVKNEPKISLDEVKDALFIQDEGTPFHSLGQTLQSISSTGAGGVLAYDQEWVGAFCTLDVVQHRHIAIARLHSPINLGRTMEAIRFITVVVGPPREKGTKTALETTRTFATLFSDGDVRRRLLAARTIGDFKAALIQAASEFANDKERFRVHNSSLEQLEIPNKEKWCPGRGIIKNFKDRVGFYASDYYDGVKDLQAVQKTLSTTVFIYITCLLPAVAFGVFNDENTHGSLNVKKVILAQAIGGIFFAVFSGQPMNIALTTAPLAIYIKVIYDICESLGYDFFSVYTCVGLSCQFFLIICALTEAANVMKWATRSTEELFGMFIMLGYIVNAIGAIYKSFQEHYFTCDEAVTNNENLHVNQSDSSDIIHSVLAGDCNRDTAILFIILTCGTLWIGLSLFNLRGTTYLTRRKRDIFADYALAIGVIVMSFIGTFCFSQVAKDIFDIRLDAPFFTAVSFSSLPLSAYGVSIGLGFSLCFLFFMDQSIVTAAAENPQHKLLKPKAPHMDLLIVAVVNIFLSIVGMPWMHASIPQAPLHVRALADIEERVVQGHVYRVITKARETRLPALFAHILMLPTAFWLLPYLPYIPTAVLHGLFLYMAITSLVGNELFERILLFITEQQAYPPNHYIRQVPQRTVHLFTFCQLIQLGILCGCGFSSVPYIEMIFPIVIFSFIPI
uniref:Bicarbonate transporter-like transmembrane domain-containing protein n=1 Tax=Plectus sambesii TaxID=2011161 RepID=A0A914WVI2_9BILA